MKVSFLEIVYENRFYICSHVAGLLRDQNLKTILRKSRVRGGAKGGLEGVIASCRNMLAPHRKVKNCVVGDFWHVQYPESCILAPLSEESAPLLENFWPHP